MTSPEWVAAAHGDQAAVVIASGPGKAEAHAPHLAVGAGMLVT